MNHWIVRHGAMRLLGDFDPEGGTYVRGNEVVVRTDRGMEVGQVLCPVTSQALSLINEPTTGRILRTLSERDQADWARIKEAEKQQMETCERFVATRRLQMELVDVEKSMSSV